MLGGEREEGRTPDQLGFLLSTTGSGLLTRTSSQYRTLVPNPRVAVMFCLLKYGAYIRYNSSFYFFGIKLLFISVLFILS